MGETAVRERAVSGSGGGYALPSDSPGSNSDEPAFAAPFEGWMTWADAVSDDAPGVGSLMRIVAQLYRTALEGRASEHLTKVWEILRGAGIPNSAVDQLADSFLGNVLPVSPDTLTEELRAALQDLQPYERDLIERQDETTLVDAACAVFIDGFANAPNSRYSYDYLKQWLENLNSEPAWWVAASIELPSALGRQQHSIFCSKPAHRRGDRIEVVERTYLGDIVTSLNATVENRGPIEGEYRKTVDTLKPHTFWDNVRTTSGLVYAVQMIDSRRNRALRWLGNCLNNKGPQIKDELQKIVDDAKNDVQTALEHSKDTAFMANSIVGLLVAVASALVERIRSLLARAFADESLTTWLIWHMVAIGSDKIPISTFTLTRDGRPGRGLCFYADNPESPGQLIISNDYDRDPGVRRKARFMIGPSEIPDGAFDARLWDAVADANAAVPWTDPMNDRGGFRVLVPQTAGRSGASYVTALRVDLQLQ
jgi:hypothetical protein